MFSEGQPLRTPGFGSGRGVLGWNCFRRGQFLSWEIRSLAVLSEVNFLSGTFPGEKSFYRVKTGESALFVRCSMGDM
jgi:hypothetical protein